MMSHNSRPRSSSVAAKDSLRSAASARKSVVESIYASMVESTLARYRSISEQTLVTFQIGFEILAETAGPAGQVDLNPYELQKAAQGRTTSSDPL